MKSLLKFAVALSTLLSTGLLSGCDQSQPEPLPIPAPQNILVIPDENDVTVVWDAVVDARVKGYNVYQDGTKVNTAPVLATSRVQAQNTVLGGIKPITFVVKNVPKTKLSDFSVRAITDLGEGLVSPLLPSRPLLCTRHKVEGTDMGGLAQNVRLTKSAANLTTATVTVITGSRTVIPFVPSASIYQGNLPATVAVGGLLQILTNDDNCLVYAYDSRPESPVMTAPVAGINVSSSAVLPVAWTNATNPDRFVVVATWLEGSSGLFYRSSDLPGTARTFDIPAGSLPSDKAVKIRVYAYNDGTENFIGAYATGSRMAIRNGDEAGRDITTTVVSPPTASNPGVSWGDPHLITFDQLSYEFQSVGEYDLGYSSDNRLRVQARQQPWGGSTHVSVNTAIATKMNGQKVGLYLNPPAGQSPLRIGNVGTRTDVPAAGLDLGAGNKVILTGSTYKFLFADGDIMTAEMNGNYINARIFPVLTRASTMKGLLGNFDGNLTNEFIKRDGGTFVPLDNVSAVREYAASWKIPSLTESYFVYDGSDSFGGFDNTSFPSATPPAEPAAFAAAQAECTAAGVQPKNIDGCAIDKTQTGDTSFVTSAARVQEPVAVIAMTPTPSASTLPGVSWGDPHLITFDQTGVEFQSVGEFDLGYSSDNQLKVQARQQPWGSSTSVSINTAIATRMNGQKVGLYVSSAGLSPLRIGDTGDRTVVPNSGLDLGAGHIITQVGNVYTLRFPTGDRVEIGVESYVNVAIYPASSRAGTMKGLLGNKDGNTTNDIFLRDGSAVSPFNASTFYGVYADSWRIPSLADSLFVYDGSDSFGGFNDPDFPRAAAPIDPGVLAAARVTCDTAGVAARNLEECASDVAITGVTGFAISAATVPNPVGDTIIPPTPKPDLVIKSASLSVGNVCRPYNTFVSGQVSVQNIGTATAMARSDVGVVQLVDARDELLGAGYRGNGVGIPEIPAGGSASVEVNIFYPISTPEDTEGVRTYVARVDFGNYYDELNETNNRLADTVQITIPVGHCKNRVALIHGADSTVADAYQPGLTAKGFRTTKFAIASLNSNSSFIGSGWL